MIPKGSKMVAGGREANPRSIVQHASVTPEGSKKTRTDLRPQRGRFGTRRTVPGGHEANPRLLSITALR